MHVSVILAGASVAILALSDYENIAKQLYGLIMLPVAVAFLVYAMYQCKLCRIAYYIAVDNLEYFN